MNLECGGEGKHELAVGGVWGVTIRMDMRIGMFSLRLWARAFVHEYTMYKVVALGVDVV